MSKKIQTIQAVCLDTRVLSQFLNRKQKAKQIIKQFQEKHYEIYTTTINISEFFIGLYKIHDVSNEELNDLKKFFNSLHPRSMTYESALYAGRLYGTILKGSVIGWRDTFIASIVKENGNAIITSNIGHFERIPGLEIIEY